MISRCYKNNFDSFTGSPTMNNAKTFIIKFCDLCNDL